MQMISAATSVRVETHGGKTKHSRPEGGRRTPWWPAGVGLPRGNIRASWIGQVQGSWSHGGGIRYTSWLYGYRTWHLCCSRCPHCLCHWMGWSVATWLWKRRRCNSVYDTIGEKWFLMPHNRGTPTKKPSLMKGQKVITPLESKVAWTGEFGETKRQNELSRMFN